MIDELTLAIEQREFVDRLTADTLTTIKDCFCYSLFDKRAVRLRQVCGFTPTDINWFVATENIYFTDINTFVPIGSSVRMIVGRKNKGIRLDRIFKPTD